MADPKIDLTGAPRPTMDGDVNLYTYKEAVASDQFNRTRKVVFINGMGNSPDNHAESALALSWVQMCSVVGVYNKTGGFLKDLIQCVGDKVQFNGPVSASAGKTVKKLLKGQTSADAALKSLERNEAQVHLFQLLRQPEHRSAEIFAHSQGNLILSNVLQAIHAVDGDAALMKYTVHTFGSPAANWPTGLKKFEHGFTFDPVTWLAGFDKTWSISKVGMPRGTKNPITHGFLFYLNNDPAFIVNRFRVGSLGVTFNMDEDGLALALAEMGTNTRRVLGIFEHLDKKHNSDADDVAVRYVANVRNVPSTVAALKGDKALVARLVKVMNEGWTSADEKTAIAFLKAL